MSSLHIPHMVSLPMYFTSSPHSAISSTAVSPSPSAYVDPFSRPESHTSQSSSSTSTVSSTTSEIPRSLPILRPRSSFDPLSLPSYVPAEFNAPHRPGSAMPHLSAAYIGRPRSSSHNTQPETTSNFGGFRATSQPPTSTPQSPTARPEHGYSAMTSGFASLGASRKNSPVLGPRPDRFSEEVREEMRLFRD